MIRVRVLSPYPAMAAGLRAILEETEDLAVAEAEPMLDAGGGRHAGADVALVDGDLGEAALVSLTATRPDLPIVLLGGDIQGDLASRRHAQAFLRRDATAEEILGAVQAVASGLVVIDPTRLPEVLASDRARADQQPRGEPLTPRELEVLQLLADGLPNKTIARQLEISEHTAKFHVSSLLSKLGAYSRTEAVSIAARRGLLVL